MIQNALRVIIKSFDKNPRKFYMVELHAFKTEPEFKEIDAAELATEAINALHITEVGWTCWSHKDQISRDPCGPDSYPIFRMKGTEE